MNEPDGWFSFGWSTLGVRGEVSFEVCSFDCDCIGVVFSVWLALASASFGGLLITGFKKYFLIPSCAFAFCFLHFIEYPVTHIVITSCNQIIKDLFFGISCFTIFLKFCRLLDLWSLIFITFKRIRIRWCTMQCYHYLQKASTCLAG